MFFLQSFLNQKTTPSCIPFLNETLGIILILPFFPHYPHPSSHPPMYRTPQEILRALPLKHILNLSDSSSDSLLWATIPSRLKVVHQFLNHLLSFTSCFPHQQAKGLIHLCKTSIRHTIPLFKQKRLPIAFRIKPKCSILAFRGLWDLLPFYLSYHSLCTEF